MSNHLSFVPLIGKLLGQNFSSQRIEVPLYVAAATSHCRTGNATTHPLPLSHLVSDDYSDTVFLASYVSRWNPFLHDVKINNSGEMAMTNKIVPGEDGLLQHWSFEGKFYVVCAPHLHMRFPPPRLSKESLPDDPRIFWEKERLRLFERLSPTQRSFFIPGGEGAQISDSQDSLDEMVSRSFSTTSLVELASTVSSGDPAYAMALENFILIAFKVASARMTQIGSKPENNLITTYSSDKDGVWTARFARSK
jgi:hypothetical protein